MLRDPVWADREAWAKVGRGREAVQRVQARELRGDGASPEDLRLRREQAEGQRVVR